MWEALSFSTEIENVSSVREKKRAERWLQERIKLKGP
jgi:hypothetical protein